MKKEDHGALSAEERPAVIIPKHLQVSDADVSHLKFGNFDAIAANLQELSLKKEDHGALSAEERPAVIIPKHLQVSDADMSRLKFGNFDAEERQKILRLCTRQPIHHQPYARNQDYGQLRSLSDTGVASTPDIVLANFGNSSTSQPEITRTESLDLEHGPQYNFPTVSGYSFSSNVGSGPEGYLQQQYPYPSSNLLLIRSDTTSSHSTQQSLSTSSIPTGHMRPQLSPVDRNSQPTLNTNIGVPFQPQSNAYPYRLPATGTQQEAAIASGLSGSEIRTGIRGRRTLNPFAPPYTPVRHNQPWYYYSIPQQSFPRPIPAMLTITPSNLPTEFQEHQWNLPAGNLNHSEDPQSQRSDQMWRNQP